MFKTLSPLKLIVPQEWKKVMLDQYKLQTVKLVQKKYNDVGACYKEGALHVEKKVKRAIKFSTGLCIVSLYGTLFAHYLRGYPQMTSGLGASISAHFEILWLCQGATERKNASLWLKSE